MASDTSHSASPPTVPRVARKPIAVVACGLILAGLLLVVLLNLEGPAPAPPRTGPVLAVPDAVGLIEPVLLTTEELTATDHAGAARTIEDAMGDMPARGWIQVSGPDGRLAQQYRFERLDADPEGLGPGWIDLTEPEFEVYGSGGSVIVLTGERAVAFAPNNAIESGTISGGVVIQRFEGIEDRTVDRSRDEPTLVVRTEDAVFDNILGRVRAGGAIHAETPRMEFLGFGLTLLFNDFDRIIQRMEIETVDFIRLGSRGGKRDPTAPPATVDVPPAAADSHTTAPTVTAGIDPAAAGAAPGPAPVGGRRDEPAPAAPDVQFYLLVLHDDVRIVQGGGATARTGTGDTLSVVFSGESEGIDNALVLAPALHPADILPSPARVPPTPRPIAEILLRAAIAGSGDASLEIAPPRRAGDTIVTCSGPLTMVPLPPDVERPASPTDARLDLVGRPVRLDDRAGEANARCGRLRYHVERDELELLSAAEYPLRIVTPELDADGDRFWFRRAARTAGFTGPGRLALRRAAPDEYGPPPPPAESLHIDWLEKVDLAFGTKEATTPGLGPLERAAFDGDVHVTGDGLVLTGAAPDARRAAGTDAVAAPGAPRSAGSLHAGHVVLDLEPDGSGPNVAPRHLWAAGDVEVTDAARTMWAQALDVWFLPGGADAPGDGPAREIDRIAAHTLVHLRLEGGEHVFADRLDVDGVRRTALLTGRDVRLVDGSGIIDHVEAVAIDDDAGHYVIAGRGRFRQFDRPVIGDSVGDGKSLFDHVAGAREELRVTWRDGVELTTAADGTGPQLARFTGSVVVLSPDLRLDHADELIVRFRRDGPQTGADANASTRVESIDAMGDVRAQSTGRDGLIETDDLHVDVEADPWGRIVPTRVVATGHVHVADEQQDLWSGAMTTTFRTLEPGPNAPDADDTGRRVAVDRVHIDGGLQIRLAGGEWVFGERLRAGAAAETAEIFGPRVLVIAGDLVLDRGTHLILDRGHGRYEVEGPGTFFQLREPVTLPPASGPIGRPSLEGERTLEAVWTASAVYVEGADGAGTLDLNGDVEAWSRPDPLQSSTIEAGSVTLDFVERREAGGETGEKELARLVARFDARIENRTWRDEERSAAPRVYYVAGEYVEYDQRTLEALVEGGGELLIRDEWTDEKPDGSGRDQGSRFGAKGTTLFRFRDRLAMTREVDDLFVIVMNGDVDGLHQALDGATSTVSGQELAATVLREDAPEEQEGDATDATLRFGGAMTMRRLRGRGGLYIRTARRDVACDTFDYNLATGFAELSADTGRTVSVLDRGHGRPVRAQHMLWDMTHDTITVYRGGG